MSEKQTKLDRLIELEKKATEADWCFSRGERPAGIPCINICESASTSVYTTSNQIKNNAKNMELIAESRNALPDLLAVARAARDLIYAPGTGGEADSCEELERALKKLESEE